MPSFSLILSHEHKELADQNDLGFQVALDLSPQALALFGRRRGREFGKGVTAKDETPLVDN
ncbi:MAG: hypothetical protein DMG06_07135 [Acidobacteria bacterium]|nr:MAG: hypothetical protein DMG06_07135 [Acidobacteriota bacterium]